MQRIIVNSKEELFPIDIVNMYAMGERIVSFFVDKENYSYQRLLNLVNKGVLYSVRENREKFLVSVTTESVVRFES